MNLNLLIYFLKDKKEYNNCIFIYHDNIFKLYSHINGIVHYIYMDYLSDNKLINLPKTIINLLISKSLQKHKLALNLLKNLDPNKIYI